jgi:two-component system KDP operon response regulator KdpE
VWGPGHEEDTHYLRVYIAHLREKIESKPDSPEIILTELGVGYRFFMPS